MQVAVNVTPQQVVLTLRGRFDYDSRRDFDAGTQRALNEASAQIVINLKEVEYMDSSALGMLLVLRDKAQQKGKSVVLSNCEGFVKKILEVANFHRLFASA